VSPRLVALLGALTAVAPLSIDMYVPAFSAIAADLRCPPAAVPATLASFFAAFAVGQLAAGPIADRFGRRRPLLVGLTLYVGGSLACTFAPSLAALIAARALQAFGGAFAVVIPRALVRDRTEEPAVAAQLFSRLILVMGIAPIVAPSVGGALLGAVGWRSIFGVQAAIGTALLAAVLGGLPSDATVRRGATAFGGTVRALFGDRPFVANALAGAFGNAAMFAYISGSPFVLIEIHHVPAGRYALYFGANAAALILSSQLNARLARSGARLGPLARRSGLFVGGAGLAVLGASRSGHFLPLVAALFVFVGSLGFLTPNTTALALAKHGTRAGFASATLGFLSFSLAAAGAALVTRLHDGTARPMALTVAAFALLAAVASVLADSSPPPPASGAGNNAKTPELLS
jgi:DHA1 family bicyclomycin/chloramphenicol resistance-like MFS transporter